MMRRYAAWLVALLLAAGAVTASEVAGPAGEDYEKAMKEAAAGRLQQAVTLLQQASKKVSRPDDGVKVAGALARVYAGLGRYAEAKAFLQMRAGKGSGYVIELARLMLTSEPSGAVEARQMLRDVVGREPKNKDAWIEYGRALSRSGDLAEALRAFAMVSQKLDPKDLRAYHGQAEVFVLRGEFEPARGAVRQALKIDPESALSHVWMGRTYDRERAKAGNYTRAIESYENAYRLERGQSMHLAHVLFDLVMSDDHDLARSQAKRLGAKPDDSVAQWFEGLTKELAGDVAAALDHYRRAVALNPRNIYAHFALAHVLSGEPTPGFGPVGGARAESWRYVPYRDLSGASSSLATIRLEDPTFPFLSRLEAMITEHLAAAYPATGGTDEATAARFKKMVDYFQYLQSAR